MTSAQEIPHCFDALTSLRFWLKSMRWLIRLDFTSFFASLFEFILHLASSTTTIIKPENQI
jgi:hypothetical protein